MPKRLKLTGFMKTCNIARKIPKKAILFIIGENQEIPKKTGNLDLGVQNETEQRLTQLCQEIMLVIANTLSKQHKRKFHTWTSPDDQYQTRLLMFFAAKDEEALHNK